MIGFTLSPEDLRVILNVLITSQNPVLLDAIIEKLSAFSKEGVVICDPNSYEEMVEDQIFLQCLQAAGVDNWDGYYEAQEMMEEDF